MPALLDLTKTLELNLVKANILVPPQMAVKFAVDKSGSMDDEFRCGWVQDTIDLFLAAAMKFDDDGKMEIGFFNTAFKKEPDVTEADAGTYIRKHRISAGGGTNFADAVREMKWQAPKEEKKGILGSLFGGKKEKAPAPNVYLSLLTDGQNNDQAAFERELANTPNTFIQIVGIGTGVDENYLDNVARKFDNVSVVYLRNPKAVTADKFYEVLLNEDFKRYIGQ